MTTATDKKSRVNTFTLKPDLTRRIEKIVVSTGIGRLSAEPGFTDKILPQLMADFGLITGQKPSTRPARKSIAGFKLREGTVVGLSVTLRGPRMRDFLSRMIAIVFPRIRDFRGVSLKSVDEKGNLNIGIRENVAFSEVELDTSKRTFGLAVTIVPRNRDRVEAIALYRELSIPFEKQSGKR